MTSTAPALAYALALAYAAASAYALAVFRRHPMRLELQHKPRPSGYVTQAMIDRHGSYRAALAWLNARHGVRGRT
ncbi:hypothetical protein EYB45_10980 [Erythrobacteraceae bacterium CFH 75059]|uniref:hypothetical protein n=1 Tax=Qipengyuania thermophila TaxID=2509361 RepID=UPI001020DE23|nr:hypothetical protein [Qipengyuania thermophila]TCD00709.1 hypothetical protein EYB45_10980 [Erythrobacteraceae bacterium CFH 75059]